MADLYFIVGRDADGEEVWRSMGYKERRMAELMGRLKEKANPDINYRLELQKHPNAFKY